MANMVFAQCSIIYALNEFKASFNHFNVCDDSPKLGASKVWAFSRWSGVIAVEKFAVNIAAPGSPYSTVETVRNGKSTYNDNNPPVMDARSSSRNMRKDFNDLKHGKFLCWPAMTLSTSDVKQVRHRHWQWPPSRKSNRILLCHCGTIIQTICGCYDTVAFHINVTKIYGINIFIALSHYDRYLGLFETVWAHGFITSHR